MNWRTLIISLFWLGSVIGLHSISRSDFYTLWGVYSLCFGAYAWLIFSRDKITLKAGLLFAIGARLGSFFFEPLLSDDFYRFIWDGMLRYEGVHPMAYTPAYLMQHPEIFTPDASLYSSLSHKEYHSVYPPLAQWIYTLSYAIHHLNIGGHILFLKGIACATDLVVMFLLFQVLRWKNQDTHHLLWYGLNPLVLIEYTGNLHLDNLMIAGLLGAIWLSGQGKTLPAALAMTASILSKLVTLVLIPFMPVAGHRKKMILFAGVTVTATALVILFDFGGHTGWIGSVGLWFKTFEFNAGLYYLAREWGYRVWGYNRIALIGPALACLTMAGMFFIWWKYVFRKQFNWANAMLYVMTLFFLTSTTIHPWYIGLPLVLGILSPRTYPVIWTYLVFLSYSHYLGGAFEEKYILLAAEYLLLLCWMGWEWRRVRI